VTEQHWPGEDRIAATDQEEPGVEEPQLEVDGALDEVERAEAEPDAEPEPEPLPLEELPDDPVEQRRDGDTPVPEAAPAEEDELPPLRPPGHAAGQLSIPDGYGVITGSADGGRRRSRKVGPCNPR